MGAERTRARRAPPHQRTPIERTFKARGAHRNAHTLDIHSEPALLAGESGGEVAIYLVTVPNVSEEILTTHLLRNWLQGRHGDDPDASIGVGSISSVPKSGLRATLRSVPGEVFHVSLSRVPYHAILAFTNDTGRLGWLEINQYRTDKVEAIVIDDLQIDGALDRWPAGTICRDLVDWLRRNYDPTVLDLVLTPAEQEEFDQADDADKQRVVERAKRRRDEHNQRAIDRIEDGEPEWIVRQDWRQDYYVAKRRYPEDMDSREDQLWRKNVLDHVDLEKANENRSRRENSAEK